MVEKYLIDTNVLIHFPSVVTNFQNISIHLRTIEELDYLKESENSELAYRARKAAKLVEHNLQKISIEKDRYRQKKVDDTLLKCAKKKKLILVTNDLTLRLKCKFNGVHSQQYTNGDKTIYTGIERCHLYHDEDPVAYAENYSSDDLFQNQFLVLENRDETIMHTDGTLDYPSPAQYIKKDNSLIEVRDHVINNAFYNRVQPRNVEQKCLLHALFDDKIKILCVAGSFGTGKLKCSLVE